MSTVMTRVAMLTESDEEECCDGQLTRLYENSGRAGTMYGMLLESIQHYVQALHGRALWLRVLENACMRNVVFTTHRRYADEMMVRLARACAAVTATGTADQYMHFFGQCFVEYWTHYGYDRIMRVSGRHYRDFLHGIDNLHETMRFSYPKMRTPSFYVSGEDRTGCILHYRSKRGGFTHYVIGQLQQCALKFYQVSVDVRVLEEKQTDKGSHTIYRLDFDNSAYTPIETGIALYPGSRELPYVNARTFFKVFPFCIVFNKDMEITYVGQTVSRLLPDSTKIGSKVTANFMLRRPRMDFTWESVACLQKVIFELESISPVLRRESMLACPKHSAMKCDCKLNQEPARRLLLKGQMRYIRDLDGIAFLGAPLLNNLEEMKTMGLYINDLNMYDSSRDMVMAGWQHASKLECSIEQQVEKSRQIAENLRQLDEWRQRSETLLYSMIPQQIADRLRNGEDSINTCECFSQVTILFSYMIGFTDLCASTPPTQLVECINNVFIIFDAVVDKYEVFKVETLGDAVYMVAGGVPDRKANHAESVANVALELIDKVKHIQWPTSFNEPLQVRLGMHTGSIVAGVVGKRMPQYCLFGDTVNTAARMQTNSISGKIHLSEPCHQCLKGTEFVTVFRGRMNVKGKGRMSTYWLAGRKDDPDIAIVCAELRQRHTDMLKSLKSSDSYDLRKVHKQSEAVLYDSDQQHDSDVFDESVQTSPTLNKHDGNRGDDYDYITFTARSTSDDADPATYDGATSTESAMPESKTYALSSPAPEVSNMHAPTPALAVKVDVVLSQSSSSSVSSTAMLSPSIDASTVVMPCGLGLSFEDVSSVNRRPSFSTNTSHKTASDSNELACPLDTDVRSGLTAMLRCPFSGLAFSADSSETEDELPKLIRQPSVSDKWPSDSSDDSELEQRTPGGATCMFTLQPDSPWRPRSSSMATRKPCDTQQLARCESAAAGLESLSTTSGLFTSDLTPSLSRLQLTPTNHTSSPISSDDLLSDIPHQSQSSSFSSNLPHCPNAKHSSSLLLKSPAPTDHALSIPTDTRTCAGDDTCRGFVTPVPAVRYCRSS